MAAIQDLPTELLWAIFRAVQGRDLRPRPSTSLSCYRSRLYRLASLLLVCKGWRETILEDGVLWSAVPVDTSRPDCLESISTVLERSNGAELELSVYLDGSSVVGRTGDIVRTLRYQRARVRSLYLSASPHCVPEREDQLLGIAADAIAAINEFMLPELHPPARYPTSLFQSLSNLSLSLPRSAAAVDVSTILNIIKSCEGLERLSLTSFRSVKRDCPPTSAVQMPRLFRISLRDCDSATILSHIATPATSFVDVVMDSRRTRRSPPHTHILTAFPHFPTNTHALKVITRLILEEDEDRHELSLGLGPFHSRSSSLVIRNRCPSSEKFIPKSLDAIAAHPHFGAIRSFTFSCTSCAPASWSLVLNGFPLLSELNTPIQHATDAVCALMHTRFDESPLCPSLERIRFRAHRGGEDHGVYPQLFDSFRKFREELYCSTIKITLHYPGKRTKEL